MTADLVALPAFGPGGRIPVAVESPRGSAVKLKYEPGLQACADSGGGNFGDAPPLSTGKENEHARYP